MEAILQFMYDGNYTVQELNYSGVTGCIEHHDRIEYHGSIYILAGSLAIRGLKELVIHKFHQLLREDWNDVRDSIFDLLPSLSTDDKLLRPLQIKTAVERMGDLLGDKSIVDLPKWEYHAWGDIVKAFKADRAEKVEFQTRLEARAGLVLVYTCGACHEDVEMVLRSPLSNTTCCSACGTKETGDNWEKVMKAGQT